MAQQLNKVTKHTLSSKLGLNPITNTAEEADAEDKRIKGEEQAFASQNAAVSNEALLEQKEKKQRSNLVKSQTTTSTNSLLR
tara:strand:+ start:2363 stop:2608 length:246 start_codon:yes stop_codon:yes gene_type:complete